MSKKDKSKFHRRIKAQILHEITKVKTEPVASSIASQPISQPKIETAKPETAPIPGMGLEVDASADTLQLVRYDLKKSAIIIGSIILFIIVLYFIDQKTGILIQAGDKIFKVLHIGS